MSDPEDLYPSSEETTRGLGILRDPVVSATPEDAGDTEIMTRGHPAFDDLDTVVFDSSQIEATQPFHRDHVFGASALPTVIVAEPPTYQASSIAPIALDVAATFAEPTPRFGLTQTHKPRSRLPIVAAALAGGLALSGALIVTLVLFGTSGELHRAAKSTAGAVEPRSPHSLQPGTARTVVIESPEATPTKKDAPRVKKKAQKVESAASDSPAPSVEAPLPAPVVAPAPTPPPPSAAAAPPAAPTTGVITVPSSMMTVMVDGDYKRVQGGRIVVSCGKHKVNAGRGTQVIDVPCGGAAPAL